MTHFVLALMLWTAPHKLKAQAQPTCRAGHYYGVAVVGDPKACIMQDSWGGATFGVAGAPHVSIAADPAPGGGGCGR